jgi:hypothetical protein
MKLNGFLNEPEYFVASFRDCHAPWQVRDVRAKTAFALFDDDGVFHTEILFQTGLFENGVKRSNRNVNVWFTRNRHGTSFSRVFELPMAAFGPG